MRAVWVDRFGPPEVLELRESPDPSPGNREVLVAVEACGVQFGETLLRAGAMIGDAARRLSTTSPPFVLGNEIGGVIVGVGPGSPADLVGRKIVARTGGFGGYADRAVVAADAVIPVPSGLAIADAVALIAQGRTALQVTREARVQPGDCVLVEAAAGGVGTLLVQTARRAGAETVIGAVGSPWKCDVVLGIGADAVVTYDDPGWHDEVRRLSGGEGVDVVFDSVGGDVAASAFSLLRPGIGRFAVFGFASREATPLTARQVLSAGVEVIGVGLPRAPSPEGLRALIAEAIELAAAGELRPVIGQRHALADAAAAHAAVEARATIGKTVLEP